MQPTIDIDRVIELIKKTGSFQKALIAYKYEQHMKREKKETI